MYVAVISNKYVTYILIVYATDIKDNTLSYQISNEQTIQYHMNDKKDD